jgi:hypothetical protein
MSTKNQLGRLRGVTTDDLLNGLAEKWASASRMSNEVILRGEVFVQQRTKLPPATSRAIAITACVIAVGGSLYLIVSVTC